MPCSFCGTTGHNRRTCQRFDLLIQERNENRGEEEIENRVFRNAQIRQELEHLFIVQPHLLHTLSLHPMLFIITISTFS